MRRGGQLIGVKLRRKITRRGVRSDDACPGRNDRMTLLRHTRNIPEENPSSFPRPSSSFPRKRESLPESVTPPTVIPAQAGIPFGVAPHQTSFPRKRESLPESVTPRIEIPACAGMTRLPGPLDREHNPWRKVEQLGELLRGIHRDVVDSHRSLWLLPMHRCHYNTVNPARRHDIKIG